MAGFDFDLFVIGGGSGGVRAARIAGGHGARVAIAEEYRYGGTCVIRGCIPKKLLVYASHFAEDFEDAAAYGWEVGEGRFDWSRLIAAKDEEIDRLNGIYEGLLSGAGVESFHDRAVVEDPHTIRVGERRVTAEKILIATGSAPWLPMIPGIEHAITSNEAFHLERLPERVVIVGGGYIAVEFAGIFNGLGAEVVELYRREQILRGFDDDLRHGLAEEMGKKGIEVRCGVNVMEIAQTDGGLRLHLTDESSLETDYVLYATGRRPNTEGLGLEAAGVATDEVGAVVVDAHSRSTAPSIFAVGDVTDRINLTPVAIMEGHAFADSEFGGRPRVPDHKDVAAAVFSQPPIATVGLTEAEAHAELGEVDIYKSSFRPLKHTLTGREEMTMMKLVVEPGSGRIVGAHMLGADAPEIVQAVAVAIKCGATKADF
ncbi:MAG: glutathione-disulfide reductase, partial [Alphaproteobacteria bacterium]|nr:glutathione-disulfide reductase [Alphaproteobacteria bacterium]